MSRKILWKRIIHNPFMVIGATLAILICVICFLAPVITPFDPLKSAPSEKFIRPDFSAGLKGHIFGTDSVGRDYLARLLYGGRYSLIIALIVVIAQIIIGVTLGMLAGYYGGWIDTIIMRLADIVVAIPQLIFAIAVIAVMGASITNLLVVIIISGWIRQCKLSRNTVSVMKKREFVLASRALGAKDGHIMFTQILPNVTTNIIIVGSQNIGGTILSESSLSFLGLGIQPPTPSWGNMISAGRTYLTTSPWLVFVPGIALMLTVLSFNFLGDGLRDVLDPKQTS